MAAHIHATIIRRNFRVRFDKVVRVSTYQPGEGGVAEHGLLLGLGQDDHPQYHTDARGDARYCRRGEMDAALSSKADAAHGHAQLHSHGNRATLDAMPDHAAAAVGQVLTRGDSGLEWIDAGQGVGSGDMLKAEYDSDGDGKVDAAVSADQVAWDGVSGKPSSFPPDSHDHDGMYEPADATILRKSDLAGTGAASTPARSDHHHDGTYDAAGTAATEAAAEVAAHEAGHDHGAFDAHLLDTMNPHGVTAAQAPYDNIASGLTATDVQAAVDALAARAHPVPGVDTLAYITSDTKIHVSASGDDSTGDGSNDAPYATITQALSSIANVAISADATVTISVADGTYNDHPAIIVTSLFSGRVNIIGNAEFPGNVVLNMAENAIGISVSGVQMGHISGFIIKAHTSIPGNIGVSVVSSGSISNLTHMKIVGFSSYGVVVNTNAVIHSQGGLVVDNCSTGLFAAMSRISLVGSPTIQNCATRWAFATMNGFIRALNPMLTNNGNSNSPTPAVNTVGNHNSYVTTG